MNWTCTSCRKTIIGHGFLGLFSLDKDGFPVPPKASGELHLVIVHARCWQSKWDSAYEVSLDSVATLWQWKSFLLRLSEKTWASDHIITWLYNVWFNFHDQVGPRAVGYKMRAQILERDRFRCKRCGKSARDAELVVDHVQPWSELGWSVPDNLQTLCVPCNIGKGPRLPTASEILLTAQLSA